MNYIRLKFNLKNINPVIIHILCWMLMLLISLLAFYNRFQIFPRDYQFYLRMLLDVLVFYLNFYVLVPKLLLNKKIVLYIVVSIAFIFLLSFLNDQLLPPKELVIDMIKRNNDIKLPDERLRNMPPDKNIFKGVQILFGVLLFAVGTTVKLVLEWYKNETQKNLIEKQKINTELSFLKAQINPHFLFNSLNSIYSLANKKSDDTTEAIITLSELMRYMLYETDKEFVPLQKEIDYIKNYIALQTLRLKDSSGVRFNVRGNLEHYIEPLLLISFIENAFKYGTDYTGKTNITIQISIENQVLNLQISNHISINEKNRENSGIGLQNIKGRLKLLYPKTHALAIEASENMYYVKLVLNLKK